MFKQLENGQGPYLIVSTFSHSPNLSEDTKFLFALGHSYPFTPAFTVTSLFVFLLIWTQPKYYPATPDLVQHHTQSPIKAKYLPLLFRPPEPNSNISTGTCKGNCPCGKMSKPPIVVLLLPLPRDTTALSVGYRPIYICVSKFFHSYTV